MEFINLTSIAKYCIFIGIFLFVTGCILYFLSKFNIGIGKLPGDILIQKDNFTFYLPIATSIIISIILTIVLNLITRK